jgi:hypothetical protein
LLLVLRALLELAVSEDLEIEQTKTDGAAPDDEHAREDIEAEVSAVAGSRRGHEIS